MTKIELNILKERILNDLDTLLRQMNDETYFDSWLMCGVPDGADEEEICYIAEDDKEFTEIVQLAGRILERVDGDWYTED